MHSSAALNFRDEIEGRSVTGYPLFVGFEPPQPKNCVTFYDLPGDVQNACAGHLGNEILVRVRSDSYRNGYSEAMKLRKESRKRFQSDWWHYSAIWITRDIASNGQDENKNFIFTFTIALNRELIVYEKRLIFNPFIYVL